MRAPVTLVPILLLASTLPAGADSVAAGDQLILQGPAGLTTLDLPRGPAVSTGVDELFDALEALPDGRLVGLRTLAPSTPGEPWRFELVALLDGGGRETIGDFELTGDSPGFHVSYRPSDLAADRRGRLFALVHRTVVSGFNVLAHGLLVEIDPSDGALRGERTLPAAVTAGDDALAAGPRGLWLVNTRLYAVDPDDGGTRDVGPGVDDLPSAFFVADDDSTGALWVSVHCNLCDPPPEHLVRLDPATGSQQLLPVEVGFVPTALTVRPRCRETAHARCLQGGRFRVEVERTDFEGTTAPGRAAPARSADSALFSFFDPANWELLVRVLDACEEDGHFWVFASASTTVATRLTVTDLETGRTASYENPLGQVARAITDTTTFDVCP